MTVIHTLTEAEAILANYIPQVRKLLGKDITLERMTPLMHVLGNPEKRVKIIHIAGTSGKTSTAYYIASLLSASGKKVGLTVSPHIDSITERVQISLNPLTENEFCVALSEFLELIKDVNPQPTYFELLIAFAYWYFAKIKVDYAVMETGLGGLHDATNLPVGPDKVCVITDIGLDHMHVLGKTLPEIAGQKAGISQPGNQVFMYEQSPVVMSVFRQATAKQQAILNTLSDKHENSREMQNVAAFQQRNWHLAKYVYDYIAGRDSLPVLTDDQLATTMHLQVPGRMDVRQVDGKTVIMDGAHNEQKMQAFVDSFQNLYPDKKAAILLSLKEGKEYQSVLPLLKPICSRLIITTFSTIQDLPVRSIDPNILAQAAQANGIQLVTVESDTERAYQELLKQSDELCVVTGSFYLISVIRSKV